MEELKMRIRQLRTMLNLSMAEFATSIQVSPGNVGDWESLKRPSVPSAAALRTIAEKYNVSLDWLLFGQERRNKSYSETVIGRYTSDSYKYEQLVDIVLKLSEESLSQLLDYAKTLEPKRKKNSKDIIDKTS